MTISKKHWSKTDKREEVLKKVSVGWKNLEKRPFKKCGEYKKCLICGKKFYVKRWRIKKGGGKYCSKECFNKSKKGKIPPNFDIVRKNSPLQKGKCPFKFVGKKHWNWQGGITKENHKIRTSDEYKKWREAVFERDNYTCVNCGVRGVRIVADHIKPFCDYPKLRLVVENGRTLCIDCDKKLGWSLFRKRNPKTNRVK